MKITIHPDSWICLCGTSGRRTGFIPCTIQGIPIPYRCLTCNKKPKYYRCVQCGRVINGDTLEVVGSSMLLSLHWEGRQILPQWSLRASTRCEHV